ncbi:hypothetical protein CEV34_3290 [Brucella pseudogrignonensis]|uniref:Uncharacterized protein n=1 Tax=Brucella pseudogrignonensis TaxID=419475 RepID=A0A256GA18_9HYPH|nr:hypothetical protein CEV34_3290 [Brucella pseudogrignonensis]
MFFPAGSAPRERFAAKTRSNGPCIPAFERGSVDISRRE